MAATVICDIQAVRSVIEAVGLDRFMDDVIEAMRVSFRDFDPEATVTIDRTGFAYDKPDLGLVEWMPTMEVGGRVSIKTVGYHPTNPTQRSMPSVMATTSLHDTTSGRLVALTDATFLTAIRTGAASALATEQLSPEGPIDLAVIGCGAQSVSQIHAISRVREIRSIRAFDPQPEVAHTLRRRLPASVTADVEVVEGDDARARMLGDTDVLVTATSVDPDAGPVVDDGAHRPHLHVNAVGADFPGKVELPRSLAERAVLVPDNQRQCLAEGEAQTMTADQLGPELFELVKSPRPSLRHELTVFDSTGWALEDLIAAEVLLGHCARLGLGLTIDLQPDPADPYDPYDAVR